jgi:hypothetical protein
MNLPGFDAERSLGVALHTYRRKTSLSGCRTPAVVAAARDGCSDCLLYTEPGPGGRTYGVRICCTTICKWGFGCVRSCWAELCWTPPPGDIFV